MTRRRYTHMDLNLQEEAVSVSSTATSSAIRDSGDGHLRGVRSLAEMPYVASDSTLGIKTHLESHIVSFT